MYQLGFFDAYVKRSTADKSCQNQPIRGYTRIWYTGNALLLKNSYKRSRTSLPGPPLLFIAFFHPLSELLEQANLKVATSVAHLMVVGTSYPGLSPVMVVSQTTGSKFSLQTMCGKLCFIFLIFHSRKFST